MKFQLRDSGLYCYSSEEWQRVGGWIEVIARTRLVDKRRGHGALLQWKNMDGVMLQEVVYARILNGENSRQVRELLVEQVKQLHRLLRDLQQLKLKLYI